jgi:hypothetical protein
LKNYFNQQVLILGKFKNLKIKYYNCLVVEMSYFKQQPTEVVGHILSYLLKLELMHSLLVLHQFYNYSSIKQTKGITH